MRQYRVAVVGATGAVGTKIVELLEDSPLQVSELRLLASKRSVGQRRAFRGQEIEVREAVPEQFEGVDIAFFSAGGSVSKVLVPEAVKRGAVVIDNTSAFRMEEEVPLVVPEVNMADTYQHKGIIANPNCSTIQMVTALKPLYDRYGIEKIIVSTYQAVSGAGQQAINELHEQSAQVLKGEAVEPRVLPVKSLARHHQIAFNAIPQIDVFQDNGFTMEEMKMVRETQKIFHAPDLAVTATCVRVPVFNGHSESVYVELGADFTIEEVRQLLSQASGVVVVDEPENQAYPMAVMASGRKEVFVGRIRKDLYHPRGLNLWIVSDNLLKGAAWNAVQIAEQLFANHRSS
ncbi:MAG: aspartate-semialdehyde dehydrogenase [Bacillus thermozeamaize]|jgi:aspartate-semialdehyde dehydrogenase|uniref:Aspartate-semialdehyde dehydrogenase n=1 Tax=Bacillus thermozeamaize TaxID=230954 RepID=A0A1Y3PQJ5_9BACI|nr:MAG: aspartate-semialdehyde dehydrogenase [Bacillus thermozeamaize]